MATTKQNLQSLRDEFGALSADMARLMDSSDQRGSDELKNRMSEIRARFESAMSEGGDGARDAIRELGENAADFVEESLRERPIATIALAAGLGFIVGVALRR
jgi:ElaB/YqjD/DUF883 family membrane-anchored ribosome-binding protein